MDDRILIARRVALDLNNGSLVNLGIGLHTLVPRYLPPDREVCFQSENGIIGMVPVSGAWMEEPSLTYAGGSFVGAMNLATGAKRVIVAMSHTANGKPKIMKHCSLPLTSVRRVSLIVTELAVIEPTDEGLILRETAPGVNIAEIVAATEASLIIPTYVPEMPIDPTP
jgi:acetate CoA/acetoacetate CoA-transferase beta subunit